MLEILSSITVIWTVLIIGVIASIIALEKQEKGIASGVISLVLALLLWNYGLDLWGFVKENLDLTLYFSLGYVILGVVWSFIKWNEKVKKVFSKFKEIKSSITGKLDSTEKMKELIISLRGEFKDDDGVSISFYESDTITTIAEKITPIGLKNKGLITSWIMYWPLSLLGTLLNNPFRRFFNYIYDSVSGLYDKITQKHKNDAFEGL
jgi:hypothetical protein